MADPKPPASLTIVERSELITSREEARVEVRQFNLERARLMDEVLRAITFYTAAESAGVSCGREKVLLYGQRLPSGEYLRVVLRPGPGDAFTCVSAYPVPEHKPGHAKNPAKARPVKFPPEYLTKK